MAMEVVDSHHHFWDLSPSNSVKYDWLAPVSEGGIAWHPAGDVNKLKQSYLLDNYLSDANNSVSKLIKSVHVQAEAANDLEEVKYLDKIAQENPGGFPHGIVAHADLSSPELPKLIETYVQDYPRVKGVRQLLNWSEKNPRVSMCPRGDFLKDKTWVEGFQLLMSNSLSFDFHVYPSQMADAAQVARQCPNGILVLDHCGLPVDGMDAFDEWKEGMKHMAAQSNVICKLSGLVMFNHAWSKEVFSPYIVECLQLFTPKRCMFGSNFPVDRLNITYEELVKVYRDIAVTDAGLTNDELELIFKQNAIKTYRLDNN
jgi:predicted TIM-barrel fold metal-dependent hydrolase